MANNLNIGDIVRLTCFEKKIGIIISTFSESRGDFWYRIRWVYNNRRDGINLTTCKNSDLEKLEENEG